MLKHRLFFGALMIAAIVLLVWVDGLLDAVDISGTPAQRLLGGRTYLPAGLLMLAMFAGIIGLAARELHRIFAAKGVVTDVWMLTLAGISGGLVIYVVPSRASSPLAIGAIATLLVIVFLVSLARHALPARRTEGAIFAAAAAMFTLVYLGLLPGFLLAIRRWHSGWVILGIVLIAKSCDIGAYFTGSMIGKHKLIPWLSPKKTWEGLAGGITFSAIVAMFLATTGNQTGVLGRYVLEDGLRVWEHYDVPLWLAAVGGATIGAVGHAGDLVASLFKRDAGIKDSGETIPGFGGVIDVIDSAIIVAPLAYWLLLLLPRTNG